MPEASVVSEPMSVLVVLATIVAAIFWLSGLPHLKPIFEYTPPVIYVYFVPMLATTAGLTPSSSPTYGWLTRYLLPFALLLLMVSVDLKAIARLGFMALFMVVAGTLGIVLGGPLAYLVFGAFLPEGAWMGLAALSGSWIGGTANMVAIAESVGTPESVFGPVIVVDTVVGYGWMGVLLFFSGWQARFDRRWNARTEAIEETNRRLAELDAQRHPLTLRDVAVLVGMGIVGGGGRLARSLGGYSWSNSMIGRTSTGPRWTLGISEAHLSASSRSLQSTM